ncbi:iron chaperone [Streptomyces sp. NPDC085524]|uniref:iron chaperone n=1 Tax=unclassified Streptomyces TaxID=2593676 RepID=UPI0035D88E99
MNKTTDTTADTFTDEERAAMKERSKELKATARRASKADRAAEEEAAVIAKIAEMQDSDRVMAERVHAIVKASAPGLAPKLWYGMPSYARDGKVVCFFQSAEKFKARFATLGFSDQANLDEGTMWPTTYALTEITPANEAAIAALVKQSAS